MVTAEMAVWTLDALNDYVTNAVVAHVIHGNARATPVCRVSCLVRPHGGIFKSFS